MKYYIDLIKRIQVKLNSAAAIKEIYIAQAFGHVNSILQRSQPGAAYEVEGDQTFED